VKTTARGLNCYYKLQEDSLKRSARSADFESAMPNMFERLFAMLVAFVAVGTSSSSATAATVLTCPEAATACSGVPTDLLFVLDASRSIRRPDFIKALEYIDVVGRCKFTNPAVKMGLVIFSSGARTVIPLGFFSDSPDVWRKKIMALVDEPLVCCTPTADSFDEANAEFKRNGRNGATQHLLQLTDGEPWPIPTGPYASQRHADYLYKTVPNRALILKKAGVRISALMLPNHGEAPKTRYYKGQIDPKRRPANANNNSRAQCIVRQNQRSCAPMLIPPFPIVSKPVNDNIAELTSFDIDQVLEESNLVLCKVVEPTPSPTPALIQTGAPTPAQTEPELDGLELYAVLDASRSMRWAADICRAVPGGDSTALNSRACFDLFAKFVMELAQEISKVNGMGWRGNGNGKGVRVHAVAFSCAENHSVPITIPITSGASTLNALREAFIKAAVVADGGTCIGEAYDWVAARMEESNTDATFRAVVTLTDGVVYDNRRFEPAMRAWDHFGVSTYALAVSVPEHTAGGEVVPGLTKRDIRLQEAQLPVFGRDGVYPLGRDGFALLPTVVNKLAKAIKDHAKPSNLPLRPWCGFTSKNQCDAFSETCRWAGGAPRFRRCTTRSPL
jgi:hypothetical protein